MLKKELKLFKDLYIEADTTSLSLSCASTDDLKHLETILFSFESDKLPKIQNINIFVQFTYELYNYIVKKYNNKYYYVTYIKNNIEVNE